jgi:hypothetical protein
MDHEERRNTGTKRIRKIAERWRGEEVIKRIRNQKET